jgi:hypothetical protein
MAKEKEGQQQEQTVRLRFNRTCTIDGTPCQANTVAAVPATDEAWAAVNRGDAEMQPGPGVDGQPFPPESLTQAPPPPTQAELQQQQAAAREARAGGAKGKAAGAGAEEAAGGTGHAAGGTHAAGTHHATPATHQGKHVSPPGSAHGHTKKAE